MFNKIKELFNKRKKYKLVYYEETEEFIIELNKYCKFDINWLSFSDEGGGAEYFLISGSPLCSLKYKDFNFFFVKENETLYNLDIVGDKKTGFIIRKNKRLISGCLFGDRERFEEFFVFLKKKTDSVFVSS